MLLDGIKILDFTSNFAGPEAAAAMADYGAEVIKIEKPGIGDDCRFFPPIVDGVGFAHFYANRCKKSVTLNLKDPEVYPTILAMCNDADIIIEANRPGVMKRLGLDYETIKKTNPDIIYCSLSAYGQTGPYAGRAGYDIIAQAFSGIMYTTGDDDAHGGHPTRVGPQLGDFVAAMNAFGAMMTALYYREKTGKGQHLDVSLVRGLIWMSGEFSFKFTGVDMQRSGNHSPGLCPYGEFYNKKGDAIVIAAVNANLWKVLCECMGRPELMDDPRFTNNSDRVQHYEEVRAVITEWVQEIEDMDKIQKILNDAGVPNSKIMSMPDIDKDEHVNANKWLWEVPTGDNITSLDKFTCKRGHFESDEIKERYFPAPALGEHNEEILTKYGMSPEKNEELQTKWIMELFEKYGNQQ